MRRQRIVGPSEALLAILFIAALLPPGAARAQSGIRVTPDSARTLISKDIAGQRWAISRNPDHSVTGNVFFPGGGAPQFVFCTQTGETASDVSLSCSGADACPIAPCTPDDWLFIANVTLPATFFGETGGAAEASIAAILPLHTTPMIPLDPEKAAGLETTADAPKPAGLQITPDSAFTLISKDVADQRWAISRNEDGTVTGNVFFPGGGAPQFVWCEPTGNTKDPVALHCLGAPACVAAGGCSANDWTLIADVSLPASFFAPRDKVSPLVVRDALSAQFGDDGGADAVALALQGGYSLDQIVRAALTQRLQASGTILTRAGAIEAPSGPPHHYFDDQGASAVAQAAGSRAAAPSPTPGPRPVTSFVDALKGASQIPGGPILILLFLLDAGYTGDQIVFGLFTNANITIGARGVMLVDENGQIVKPEGQPGSQFNQCGNGKLDDGEICDGDELSIPCPIGTFGLPTCTSDCSEDLSKCGPGFACGNGIVDFGETCDGDNLNGMTCEGLGKGSGTLKCDASCHFDTSLCGTSCPTSGTCCDTGQKNCNGTCVDANSACCGDGVRQGQEACDGSDFGGSTCASLGFQSGTLACTSACALDTSACVAGGCGPGTFMCEGGCAPNGSDCCTGQNGYCQPGSVCVGDGRCCPSTHPTRCGDNCIAQGSSCCGNGVKEPGEECDGGDLGDATCDGHGSVSCTASCTLDHSGCSRCPTGAFECGDSCAPDGAQCCPGTSNFCDGGDVCVGGGQCCPGSAPMLCAGKCYPSEDVCCGDYACFPGNTCLGNQQCGS